MVLVKPYGAMYVKGDRLSQQRLPSFKRLSATLNTRALIETGGHDVQGWCKRHAPVRVMNACLLSLLTGKDLNGSWTPLHWI